MKITLLGAGGFVGSHLSEHLTRELGHEVLALDVTADKLGHVQGSGFEFRHVDIAQDDHGLEEAISEGDLVIDLVAYANPSLYVETPLEVFDLNFTQNLKVAHLCSRHRRRLIQYSSAEVYGKAQDGTSYIEDETDFVLGPVVKHRWIYAAAKGLLERVLHAQGLEGTIEYTIIRPFNFIGPRIDYLVVPGTMGGPRVFAHFMSALLGDGPLFLVDGGTAHRAFLHIEDANCALATILANPEAARNQAFNVGNPNNDLSVRDLAEKMKQLYEELTGRRSGSELVDVSGEAFYGPGYEDSNRLPPNVEKLGALGWEPLKNIDDTLRETMIYYLEEQAGALLEAPSQAAAV